MTDLQPLIRLHRWRIDVKRRAVADLETYRDGLEAERARRRAELDQEIALASEAEQLPPGYLAYVKGANLRLARLAKSLTEVASRIEKAREALAAEFRELKKYETAEKQREERAAADRRKAETAMYDEIGLIRHDRKRRAPTP